jgi:hypothetical protein
MRCGLQSHYIHGAKKVKIEKNKIWTRLQRGSHTPHASTVPRYYGKHDGGHFNKGFQDIVEKLENKLRITEKQLSFDT